MKYNSFEDMPVWKKAIDLSVQTFVLTGKLPKKEDYNLSSQIKRSSLSVSANIAEGFGRKHAKDKVNFYYDARGSLAETKNHLIYGSKVGYFTATEVDKLSNLIQDIWKELNFLISSLKRATKP